MNIKLFTHNDLDGIGCAVLSLISFDKVDVEYCGYNNINEKITEFIENKEYKSYDHVYITDISINEELAELIENTEISKYFNVVDHHPTAKNLEKYSWCQIEIDNELGICSGTSLFYEKILNGISHNDKLHTMAIRDFVEMVRQYDTWEWKTIYKDEDPSKWNNLLALYGREQFVDRLMNKLLSREEFKFDDTDLLLLDLDYNKKNAYFEKKAKEITSINVLEYNAGVVFADQYISELGNYLAEKFIEFDFIAMIGAKAVSYRGIRDDIDLGLVAKQFGGGGHPKAAGSQIDKNKQVEYMKSLFI